MDSEVHILTHVIPPNTDIKEYVCIVMELDKIDTPPSSPRDYEGTFVRYLQDNGFTRDVAQKVSDKLGLQNIPYCVCVQRDEIDKLPLGREQKWKIHEIVALMRSSSKREVVRQYFDERYKVNIENFLENNGVEKAIAKSFVKYLEMDYTCDLKKVSFNDVYNWGKPDQVAKNAIWRLVQMTRYIDKYKEYSKVADWLTKNRRLRLLLTQLRQLP